MKKQILHTVLALLLCTVIITGLCSCAKEKYEFVSEDGRLVHKENGVAYKAAPDCYEAISVSDTVFAEQGVKQFYEISGSDNTQWLSDSFGFVYYSDALTLPELSGMEISFVNVYDGDAFSHAVSDAEAVSALIDLYYSSEETGYPGNSGMTPTVNLRLKFADKTRGVYYVLAYYEYAEDYIVTDESGAQTNYGKAFMHNRSTGRCVAVDGLPEGVKGSK